ILFDWLDPAPEDNAGLWVWARVERREGGAAQGTQMAESALTAFFPGVQLPFSDVPYSGNLVVVVEIKEGQSKTARAKYFGESDTFALEPGKHVKVTVKLKLTKTPEAPDGALVIAEATEKGYVRASAVTLSLDPKGATAVTAANDMVFSAGAVTKKLGELQQKSGRYLWSGWDLNAGLCTGADCFDGVRTVYAKFVNDSGYESEAFSAQVTLDTTAPALAGGSVSPEFANGTSRVTVIVNPVEPLSIDPVLHVSPADPGFSTAEKVGESYVYAYDVNEGAVEGTAYSFSVDLIDLAGNEAKGVAIADTVTVDRTPPAIGAASVDKTRVGVGETVTVTFSVDEDLSKEPVVTIGDKTMSPVVGDRWSVVRRGATQTAPPAAPSAPVDRMAPFRGQAPGSHGREPVDQMCEKKDSLEGATQPTAPSPSRLHSDPSRAREQAVVLLSFGPRPEARSPKSGAFLFSYTTDGSEAEGTFLINIQIVDLAGNRHSESLPDRVTFDFTAPQVVSSVASPALAALNGEIVFQVTIDEALAAGSAPKLLTSPVVLAWTDAEVEGSSYRWKHTAQTGESGTYAIAIDRLCDDLGNCVENVTGKLAAVQIDADTPRLNGIAELLPTPDARVKTGVEVKLNVNVEENMGLAAGYPKARIGGKEMPPARAPDRGWAYSFAYTTDETKDAEGAQTVVLDLADAAGNAKTETVGIVTFDFKKPEVLSAGPSNPIYKLNDTILYTINASEPLAGTPGRPVVRVFKNGVEQPGFFGDPVNATETSFSYSKPVVAGMDETYAVKIDLADKAGNAAVDLPGEQISVDATAPAVTVTLVDGGPHRSPTGAEADVTAHVHLTVSEALDPAAGQVKAVIGDRWSVVCPGGLAKTFDCTFTVPRDLQPGDALERTKAVIVEATDAAGNATTSNAGTMTFDFTVPVLTISVNPSTRAARLGEAVSVSVTSNEALDAAGAVLDKGGMALGDPSVSGTSYTWTYAVKDTDNGTFNLSAAAKDLAGNSAAQVAKSVTVDGVVPTVSGATVNPPKVKGGEQFTLTFTASEDLAADPATTFSNGVDAAVPMSKTGQTGRQYTFTGTAPASGSAPVYTVTVGVTDPAGNSSTSNVGTMEIDNVPPTLAGLEVAPAGAKVGDTLRAVVSADEALSGPPALSARSGGSTITFTPVDSTPKKISYTYTYTVTGASSQGVFSVEPFVLSDIAGNVRNVTPAKTFTVDSTVPALNSGPTLNNDPAGYKAGDTISVTFTTSEDLDAVLPTVVLNTDPQKPLPCVAGAGTNDYTCALAAPLDGTETPEGQVGISIQLQDAAGNVGFGQATATLDFTLPSLTDSGATPDPAGLGKTLRYTVNTSEPLAGNPGRPTVKVLKGGVEQPGFFGDPATETNTSFTYVKPIAQGDDGTFAVKIDLRDVAGNEAPGIDATGFEIDATAPGFTAHDASPSRVKAAQDVTVTFTTSEDLADDPLVQLGPLPMTKTGQTGKDYTYKYTTTGAEDDGMRTVSVQISDPAGNQGSEVFSETVEFDFTAPAVASSAASPNPAKLGSVIQYQITVSESLSNTPSLSTTPVLTWTGPSQSGLTYTWTHTVGGGETGTYAAKLDQLCDQATNCVTNVTANMAGFEIDALAPSVTTHNVSPLLVKSGQDVTVTLTSSEPLANDPLVQLGSIQMAKTGQTGQDYTFKYTTQGTEGDGTRNVTVQMTDVAGNVGGAAFAETVRFDFTNPSVTTSTASPSPAKLGAVITYSATVSETITNTPALTTTPALAWAGPSQNGLTYTWTHTAASGETNTYTAKLDQLCDQAANCVSNVTANMAGLEIDAAPPAVTLLSPAAGTKYSRQIGFNTLTVTFDTENLDAVPGGLAVTASGRNVPCGAYNSAGSPRYTCSRTVDGADTEGAISVTVETRDAAGNQGSASVGVVFDFTAPVLASPVQFTRDDGNPRANKTMNDLYLNRTKFDGSSGMPQVAITFSVNEPLLNNPSLSIQGSTGVIAKNGGQSSGEFYWYDFTQAGTEVDHSGTVTATATDVVGNPTTLDLGTIHFDNTQPILTQPMVDTMLYRRITWGDNTHSAATFEVVAQDPIEPEATLLVYDGVDTQINAVIGATHADEIGNIGTVNLTPLNRVHVYAAIRDRTGNLHGLNALDIKPAEWIATMGFKVAGSTTENPHRFELRRSMVGTLLQTEFSEAGFSDGLAQLGYPPVASAQGIEGPWGRKAFGNAPSPRIDPSMAYDSGRGKVVLFGGYNGTTRVGDTWEWDGSSWTSVSSTGPSPREAGAAVYDCIRGKVVLFGGQKNGGTYDGETWEWDGIGWALVSTAGPSPRSNHAMAFDSGRGKAVLFGGGDGSLNGETWEWDGKTWSLVSSVGPSARQYHVLAHDSVRRKIVLFGGVIVGSYNGETWEWDGVSWTYLSNTGPSPRIDAALAYDPIRGKTVLVGGEDSNGRSGETWEWDGNNWVLTSSSSFSPRRGHGLAYDSLREKLVLFGGHYGFYDNETWERTQAGWARISPVGPSPRYIHSMAFDSARGKAVLFGGATPAFNDETWEWNGMNWTLETPTTKPSPRYYSAMAYDSVRGKAILFGGFDGGYRDDTWEWDGTNWTIRTPVNKPSVQLWHAMTFDSARAKVVLFGGHVYATGTHSDETWEWDGTNWTKRNPVNKPSARVWHAMAYDSARGKVVLFGGDNGADETWEWDGTDWTLLNPAHKPSARQQHALAYDSSRERVFLFGGFNTGVGSLDDAWEWNGTDWISLVGTIKPSARDWHAMVFDAVRGKIVVFGGEAPLNGETWEWDDAATAKPGQSIQVDFSAASVAPTSNWQSVTATFYSGAIGYPSGVPTNGVDLKVWDEGMWKVVATNNAPPGNPQLVSWTTTDPQVIPRLFFGDQQTLNFAVTPVAPNGTGVGEVSVDYAEVTVKYRQ
ncbi:MAG: hypothetical protein HY872_01130, partial [Chloroflexi bacterium]|nr:hypothetical protein [Chloroflexota bacterium]